MNDKILLVLFILLLLQFSCEKPANITAGDVQPKIVVNSVFTHNQILQLNVLSSTSIQNNNPILTNLDVALYSHQFTKKATINYLTPIQTSFTPDTIYKGFYHLRVAAPDYDTIYAIAKIPNPIEVTASKSDSIILYGQEVYQIDLAITDNPNLEDYYMINSRLRVKTTDGSTSYRDWEVFTADQITDNQINTQTRFNNYKNIYLSDQKVTNNTTSIRTVAYIDKQLTEDIDVRFLDSAVVELNVRRVEEDFYQHAFTIEQYQEQLESGIGLEKQYTKVHSNIEGGLGIFAGYSEKQFEFQIFP